MRRRWLPWFWILLLAAWPLAAGADPGVQLVTSGGLNYVSFPGGSAAAIVVKNTPGRLYRIINTNTTAQTVTFTCYDSAIAAQGQVLYAVVLTASQIVDVETATVNGVTCAASGPTLAGNPILVLAN